MSFGDFGGTRMPSDSGFWGSVSSDIGEGLGKVFSQVMPVWAAKELDTQQEDQLNDALFNGNYAPPTMGNYPSTTESTTGEVQPAGLLFDNVNVSGAAVLGIGVAIVAGIAIARMK